MLDMQKDRAWVYIGIPFRPSRTTYDTFCYANLPRVQTTDFDSYKDFMSFGLGMDDYWHMEAQLCSPTCCYFKGNTYHDQLDRIMWRAMQDGTVETSDGTRVAESVPEFLARIRMENGIWRDAMRTGDDTEAYASMRSVCVTDAGVTDPEKLLEMLRRILTHDQMEYIAPYYRRYAAQQRLCTNVPCGSSTIPRHERV